MSPPTCDLKKQGYVSLLWSPTDVQGRAWDQKVLETQEGGRERKEKKEERRKTGRRKTGRRKTERERRQWRGAALEDWWRKPTELAMRRLPCSHAALPWLCPLPVGRDPGLQGGGMAETSRLPFRTAGLAPRDPTRVVCKAQTTLF